MVGIAPIPRWLETDGSAGRSSVRSTRRGAIRVCLARAVAALVACATSRLLLIAVSAMLALPIPAGDAVAAAADAPPASKRLYRPTIVVRPGGWGSVTIEEVRDVLLSTADQLLVNFPGRRLDPIVVSHSRTHPVTLYKRGPNNEHMMMITGKDREWAHYAYEFAHELAHILHNHEHHNYSPTLKYHQWFEEALCETASLYALESLAVEWRIAPPRPEWAAYAPKFRTVAQRFLSEKHRRLPRTTTLDAWFEQSERRVRGDPYIRQHNEIVANILLPLFQENPEIWEAVGYLNPGSKSNTFREYLEAWRDNAPEEYRPILQYMIGLFFKDARQR